MAVMSLSREASKDEMGREIDRRGAVIDALTEERDRLKDQRDYYKARDEEGERIQAEIEAERDRLALTNAELRELFQKDGEQHASVIRDLTNRHETRITKYAERIKELRDANAELLAERDDWRAKADNLAGITGRWLKLFDDNGLGEEARALLDKHKATSTERGEP